MLARLRPRPDDVYEARAIRVLPRQPTEVAGIVETAGDGLRIRSADRKARAEFMVARSDLGGAEPGDLVVARISANRRLGLARAVVKERIGSPDDPATMTLMAAVALGLPLTFPDAAWRSRRAHYRWNSASARISGDPLVTIDGEDARDFDDAVWAAPDATPGNPAASAWWSRSPTWPTTSARTTRSTGRRAAAATPSISPTG